MKAAGIAGQTVADIDADGCGSGDEDVGAGSLTTNHGKAQAGATIAGAETVGVENVAGQKKVGAAATVAGIVDGDTGE